MDRNDIQLALDTGYWIVMFRNGALEYVAIAVQRAESTGQISRAVDHLRGDGPCFAHAPTPAAALRELAEKMIGNVL
jgi:hypothetical protein